MKIIRANCRTQFTAEDIAFIVSVLGKKTGDADCLIKLLADEETRDMILDDEELYRAFLEHRGCIHVSSHLYFFVLIRHVLKRMGIDDRNVADYVAEVLCEFARSDRSKCTVPGAEQSLDYFFEMVDALQRADERTSFYIRAYMGNHALFSAGVFLDRIRFRAESRGFPDVRYYEELGRMSYRVASDHRLAEEYALGEIYATLGERFQTARLALNDIAQRLFLWGDDMELAWPSN